METEQIENSLNQHTGTTQWFKFPFCNCCNYTEGIHDLIELCGCWWLISDYQVLIKMTKNLRVEDFFCLKITVKDKKGVTVLTDGNNNLLYKKTYTHTDFPLSEYEIFIVRNELNGFTFMLKGEY